MKQSCIFSTVRNQCIGNSGVAIEFLQLPEINKGQTKHFLPFSYSSLNVLQQLCFGIMRMKTILFLQKNFLSVLFSYSTNMVSELKQRGTLIVAMQKLPNALWKMTMLQKASFFKKKKRKKGESKQGFFYSCGLLRYSYIFVQRRQKGRVIQKKAKRRVIIQDPYFFRKKVTRQDSFFPSFQPTLTAFFFCLSQPIFSLNILIAFFLPFKSSFSTFYLHTLASLLHSSKNCFSLRRKDHYLSILLHFHIIQFLFPSHNSVVQLLTKLSKGYGFTYKI